MNDHSPHTDIRPEALFVIACPSCLGHVAAVAKMAGEPACCPLCASPFVVPPPRLAVVMRQPAREGVPTPSAAAPIRPDVTSREAASHPAVEPAFRTATPSPLVSAATAIPASPPIATPASVVAPAAVHEAAPLAAPAPVPEPAPTPPASAHRPSIVPAEAPTADHDAPAETPAATAAVSPSLDVPPIEAPRPTEVHDVATAPEAQAPVPVPAEPTPTGSAAPLEAASPEPATELPVLVHLPTVTEVPELVGTGLPTPIAADVTLTIATDAEGPAPIDVDSVGAESLPRETEAVPLAVSSTDVAFQEPVKIVGRGEAAIELRRLTEEERRIRRARRNILLLLVGAAVLIILVVAFGMPARRR
jgi:hypothetical protein